MESGTEVLRVAAAIVSAFQTAADTLETIKDRKDKKKRKKEKEIEELLELRILHKSLVEGGTRCRKHCENRHRQYSPAFEAGDTIAISALKDVVISLQTEVIHALQIARAVESSILDFTSLHETSVTSCKDATRAMDQLCQRIMASMQFQPHHGLRITEDQSDSSMRSGFASMQMSDLIESYDLPPSPPASVGSPLQPYHQRALPPLPPLSQRSLTIRRPNDISGQRVMYNTPQASPQRWQNRWISSQVNPAGEEQQNHQSPEILDPDRKSQFSIQYSTYESDRGSLSVQPASAASSPQSPYPPEPSTGNQSDYEKTTQHSQQWTASTDQAVILASGGYERNDRYTFGKLALPTSEEKASAILSQTTRLPRIETAKEHIRAAEAPEVVSPARPRPDLTSEKYPAFRTQSDYEDLLKTLPAGMTDIWMPLSRPAMHNRYHGFCKGAWQIRKAVHEGLEIQMTPSQKEPVIHWACKSCKFRTKAPNADSLPDQILFNQKYNVRYRWLFLAKSHREINSSLDITENYKYGCIFCAAQGHTTAAHEKLEHLLVHIISKHKSAMMTPEIKEKTKCIVGGVAKGVANWDIIVPESNQKGSPSVVADEFFISASRFFNRRKGKGS